MEVQRDTISSQQAISNTIMEKSKEKFEISPSIDKDNNNRLSIQVKNIGTNPVEIGNVWIVNKSGTHAADNYTVNYVDSVIPQGYGTDILATNALYMTPDDYDIKVVSTLGTIEKTALNVGGNNYLRALAQLRA